MIAANARNEMNIIQSNGGSQNIVSRQPKLIKYGSKKQILVDNEDPSARDQILPTSQSSQSPDRNQAHRLKNCLHCYTNGIETNKHTTEECPIKSSVANKFAAQEYLTRQR